MPTLPSSSRRARIWSVALATAVAAGSGCALLAPVAAYGANRARDFGEIFRVQAGVGYSAGAQVRALGLLDVGLGGGAHRWKNGVGWVYGEYHILNDSPAADLDVYWPATKLYDLGPGMREDGVGLAQHVSIRPDGETLFAQSYMLLPAMLSPPDPRSSETPARLRRWQRVHALDIEVGASCLAYVRVGFSPGELLDFLLGIFGLDIAGDDR